MHPFVFMWQSSINAFSNIRSGMQTAKDVKLLSWAIIFNYVKHTSAGFIQLSSSQLSNPWCSDLRETYDYLLAEPRVFKRLSGRLLHVLLFHLLTTPKRDKHYCWV